MENLEKKEQKGKKRISFWKILGSLSIVGVAIICFLGVAIDLEKYKILKTENEELQKSFFKLQNEQDKVVNNTFSEQELQANLQLEDLKEFLISHGKLTELVEVDSKSLLQNDLPIVTPDDKMQSIPIQAFGNRTDTLKSIPTLLYSSDYSEVRVYFYMNCMPVWEDWKEWKIDGESPSGKAVNVIPDPNNEFYYYLDLREKGIYDMCAHHSDGWTMYFQLQW